MRKYILLWLMLLLIIFFPEAQPFPGLPTPSPLSEQPVRPDIQSATPSLRSPGPPYPSPPPPEMARPSPEPTGTCLPQGAIRQSGYIRDARSGLGLSGAQVQITTPGDGRRFRQISSTQSNEEGYFAHSHMVCMRPLEYTLQITHPGYAELQLKINSESASNGLYYLQPLSELTPAPTPVPTPTPTSPPEGKIVIEPAYSEVYLNAPGFTTDIYMLNFSRPLAAYGLAVFYNTKIIEIDRSQGVIGVKTGSEGFIAAVNSYDPGILIVSGFDVDGEVPRKRMHLATLFWQAHATGHTSLDLEIGSLADNSYQAIPAEACDGLVQVRKNLPGDVSGDGELDFSDLLLLAEGALGRRRIAPQFADLDGNGRIQWQDVLVLAAQLYSNPEE